MTNPKGHITRCADSTRGLVSQTGEIVLKANNQISKGTFTFEQWAKSAQQLANLFLKAGLELPVPCLPPSEDLDLSDFIKVESDNKCERAIAIVKSFALDGEPSCRIPDQLVVFVPSILPVYAKRFRLGVNFPDLRSGNYRGRIRLTRTKTDATPAAGDVVEMDVIVGL
jgi:hypothetical protein